MGKPYVDHSVIEVNRLVRPIQFVDELNRRRQIQKS